MRHLAIVVIVGYAFKACLAYGTKGAAPAFVTQQMTYGDGYNAGGPSKKSTESTVNQADWLPKLMMVMRGVKIDTLEPTKPMSPAQSVNIDYSSSANIGTNIFGFDQMTSTKGGSSPPTLSNNAYVELNKSPSSGASFADYHNNMKVSGYAGVNQDSEKRGGQVVQAAVHTKHSFEERPVSYPYEEIEPQIIEVEGGGAPLEIHFKSSSSRIKVRQSHEPSTPAEVEMTQSEEEPHRLIHTVNKAIISEIRENIFPHRRVIQMINPVEESIHTIVAKKEKKHRSGGNKANKHVAYDDRQQLQQHQMMVEPDNESGYGARMFTSGASVSSGQARMSQHMSSGGVSDAYNTGSMNTNGFALGMMIAPTTTAPKGLSQPRRLTKGGY